MDFRDMIENGITKAGSISELARRLAIKQTHLQDMRAGRSNMPLEKRFLLADLIGIDHTAVTAAAEAYRETDPKKKAYFEQFFKNIQVPIGTDAINGRVMCHHPPP